MDNKNIYGETNSCCPSTSTSTIETEVFSGNNLDGENLSYTGGLKNVVCKTISSFEEAYPNIEINFPDWVINAVYQINSGYIFSIAPTDIEKDSYVLGGFYKIRKNDGGVEEYSPVMNPKEFREALSCRIRQLNFEEKNSSW